MSNPSVKQGKTTDQWVKHVLVLVKYSVSSCVTMLTSESLILVKEFLHLGRFYSSLVTAFAPTLAT